MLKAGAVYRQLPKEREEFQRYEESISRQTKQTEDEILRLKEQLIREKQIRLQREEYEALGKLTNEYPAKSKSRASIARI